MAALIAVKDRVQQAVTSGGSSTVTLGSATAGNQALGAGEDGKVIPGYFTDGTAWEVGEYTYTNSGTTLARTHMIASSTGSPLSLTTNAIFNCDITSAHFADFLNIAQSAPPGGRLTLTASSNPVPTADVSSSTNIYYTPYLSNNITLWDGQRWVPTVFSEYTLALGTITATVCYDVFAFLSSGALACELLAWTSATARATAITIQDGRYCKSGDKTRLYLGSFYPSSTTTTKDAADKRLLWNMYHRRNRSISYACTSTNHSYGSSTRREWGNTTNRVGLVRGLDEDAMLVLADSRTIQQASTSNPITYLGLDGVNTNAGCEFINWVAANGADLDAGASSVIYPGLGYHELVATEESANSVSATFFTYNIYGIAQC